jgi:hypothetical protein
MNFRKQMELKENKTENRKCQKSGALGSNSLIDVVLSNGSEATVYHDPYLNAPQMELK